MTKQSCRPVFSLPPVRPPSPQKKRERERRDAEVLRREAARPCYGQDPTSTKAWMKRNATPGVVVVIRSKIGTAGGQYDYQLDEVVQLHPSNKFFFTRKPLSWKARGRGRYYYSGQSQDDPTGQVDLLIPTPSVVCDAIQNRNSRPEPELVQRAIEQTKRLFNKTL